MPTATYTGEPITRMIADQTDPWVEIDGKPVDWNRWIVAHLDQLDDGDCDICGGGLLAGIIAPMNTAVGVQRCDQCDLYDGDLSAAQALAEMVGGVVKFETEPWPRAVLPRQLQLHIGHGDLPYDRVGITVRRQGQVVNYGTTVFHDEDWWSQGSQQLADAAAAARGL